MDYEEVGYLNKAKGDSHAQQRSEFCLHFQKHTNTWADD